MGRRVEEPLPDLTEEEAFLRFYYRHPQIYFELKKLAREVLAKGEQTISVLELLERVEDPTLLALRQSPNLSPTFLVRYQKILEADPSLWSLFRTKD
jgi:hypothetical protein